MADLTELQSSQSVKIAGADSSGNETYFVDANSDGALKVTDTANSSGVYGSLTVGTSAVQVKVGASNLANRKLVVIHNNSGNTMYWGFDSSVTTSNGIVLFRDQVVSIPVGPNIDIYIISSATSQNARIAEMA